MRVRAPAATDGDEMRSFLTNISQTKRETTGSAHGAIRNDCWFVNAMWRTKAHAFVTECSGSFEKVSSAFDWALARATRAESSSAVPPIEVLEEEEEAAI